jgi:hypothetical protein
MPSLFSLGKIGFVTENGVTGVGQVSKPLARYGAIWWRARSRLADLADARYPIYGRIPPVDTIKQQ